MEEKLEIPANAVGVTTNRVAANNTNGKKNQLGSGDYSVGLDNIAYTLYTDGYTAEEDGFGKYISDENYKSAPLYSCSDVVFGADYVSNNIYLNGEEKYNNLHDLFSEAADDDVIESKTPIYNFNPAAYELESIKIAAPFVSVIEGTGYTCEFNDRFGYYEISYEEPEVFLEITVEFCDAEGNALPGVNKQTIGPGVVPAFPATESNITGENGRYYNCTYAWFYNGVAFPAEGISEDDMSALIEAGTTEIKVCLNETRTELTKGYLIAMNGGEFQHVEEFDTMAEDIYANTAAGAITNVILLEDLYLADTGTNGYLRVYRRTILDFDTNGHDVYADAEYAFIVGANNGSETYRTTLNLYSSQPGSEIHCTGNNTSLIYVYKYYLYTANIGKEEYDGNLTVYSSNLYNGASPSDESNKEGNAGERIINVEGTTVVATYSTGRAGLFYSSTWDVKVNFTNSDLIFLLGSEKDTIVNTSTGEYDFYFKNCNIIQATETKHTPNLIKGYSEAINMTFEDCYIKTLGFGDGATQVTFKGNTFVETASDLSAVKLAESGKKIAKASGLASKTIAAITLEGTEQFTVSPTHTIAAETDVTTVTWLNTFAAEEEQVVLTEEWVIGSTVTHPDLNVTEELGNNWYNKKYTAWGGDVVTDNVVFTPDLENYTYVANVSGIQYYFELKNGFAGVLLIKKDTVDNAPAEVVFNGFLDNDKNAAPYYELNIGGVDYYAFKQGGFKANEFNSVHYYIDITVDGKAAEPYNISLNLHKYADAVDDYGCGSDEAVLAYAMVKFVVANLVPDAETGEVKIPGTVQTYLDKHVGCDCEAKYNEYANGVAANGSSDESFKAYEASYNFAFNLNEPAIKLYVPIANAADITKVEFVYVGIDNAATKLDEQFVVEVEGVEVGDNVVYTLTEIAAYNANAEFTIRITGENGVAEATFSLAYDIARYAEGEYANEAAYNSALAMYCFAEAARAYKII